MKGHGTMRALDPSSFDAFARLLSRPDPADLPRRAHVYRYDGDPNRRATRFPGILMGWLQRRHLAIDVDEPLAAATRASNARGRRMRSDLRLLRPTGTC
jgi:hypothetical protein